MAHQIETIAYANATPWHGIGKKVDASVSVDEMLVQAGLDWSVDLFPMYAYLGAEKGVIPVQRRALIRSSDDKVLTVTGDNWHPLQNRDMMEFFREFTDAGGATLETAGSLRGGKVVWALANLHANFTINGDDTVNGYCLLVSPHEVGSSIQAFRTDVRVVCANTMRAAVDAIGTGGYRSHHGKDFNPAEAKEALGLMRKQLGEAKLEAEALSSLQMSEFDTVRLLARYFQPLPDGIRTVKDADTKEKERYDDFVKVLMDTPDAHSKSLTGVLNSYNTAPGAQPGNGWGVLNGVTHWVDHVAGRSADARLFNGWLGDKSRDKLAVKRDLLALADAK